MHEIKFRAWNGSKWYDRVLASQYPDGPCSIVWDDKTKEWVNHDGVIVQFIGLRDKNCTEIYNGDILMVNGDKDNLIIVESSEEECCYYGYEPESGHSYYFGRSEDILEVVGNIYENFELVNKS